LQNDPARLIGKPPANQTSRQAWAVVFGADLQHCLFENSHLKIDFLPRLYQMEHRSINYMISKISHIAK
jgi:hypothetical protein